jgi:hypothetical protein
VTIQKNENPRCLAPCTKWKIVFLCNFLGVFFNKVSFAFSETAPLDGFLKTHFDLFHEKNVPAYLKTVPIGISFSKKNG